MVTSCSAVGCKERACKGSRLTFHRFPANPDLRKKWIDAVKRKNFEPTKNSRLCEKHFTPESYSHFAHSKRLKENAVPTIFDFSRFVDISHPNIQTSDDSEQIHCIQFADANSVKDESLPNRNSNCTVIIIENGIKTSGVPKLSPNEIDNANQQNVDNTAFPVIKSCFSLANTLPVVSKTQSFRSTVPRLPDMLSNDCTEKRLIDKTLQTKKKYKERLRVMSQVHNQLKKRKAFLENLLIRIKEKQLTSDEDVTDLMDCFMLEEGEEDTIESDDNLFNDGEYEKTISFIDTKVRKFERAVKERSTSSQTINECETFALHVESVLKSMPEKNASAAKNQIMEELKKYQWKVLVETHEEFNKTFSGLENIIMNEK